MKLECKWCGQEVSGISETDKYFQCPYCGETN